MMIYGDILKKKTGGTWFKNTGISKISKFD